MCGECEQRGAIFLSRFEEIASNRSRPAGLTSATRPCSHAASRPCPSLSDPSAPHRRPLSPCCPHQLSCGLPSHPKTSSVFSCALSPSSLAFPSSLTALPTMAFVAAAAVGATTWTSSRAAVTSSRPTATTVPAAVRPTASVRMTLAGGLPPPDATTVLELEATGAFKAAAAMEAARAKSRLADNDTGSPEYQIATWSARIEYLTTHAKANPKDHSSTRGLVTMVSKRRRMLQYLAKTDKNRFNAILDTLGIRVSKELRALGQ